MDRRAFIKGAGFLGAGAAALAAPAIARAAPRIKWRCQSSYSTALDTLFGAAELVASRVSAASEGAFEIEMAPAGDRQIVKPLAVADAVAAGEIEMCQTASYYFFARDPTFAFGTAVPFALNARQFNAWMIHGGGAALMNDFYATHNLHGLLGGNTGAQMGGWFRKEINGVADLAGVRMRTSGLAGAVLQRLGVVPQQLGAADMIAKLKAGEIDAAEWVGPYDDEKLGLNAAAPYYYYPGFWEGTGGVHYFVNLKKWTELPLAYQAMLQAASAESNSWMLAKYDAGNSAAFKRLAAGGTQVKAFPRDVLDAAYDAAFALYDETAAANAGFKMVLDSLMAFRQDIFAWFDLCENAFDSYVYERASGG